MPPSLGEKAPWHSTGGGQGARGPSLSGLQIYSEGWILSFSCAFAGWTRWCYWCIAVYFRFLASKTRHCTLYHAEHFSFSHFQPWMSIILTLTHLVLLSSSNVLGSGLGSLSDASQDATDSDVSSLTSVGSGLPSCVQEDSASASDTEIVWAKSACGVWGLANAFANRKWYFTQCSRGKLLATGAGGPCQGLSDAAKTCSQPSTKSVAKPAAQVAAKPAAKPAAPEPIAVALVEHVQRNISARKSGTQSLSLNRAEHASQEGVSGSFCGSYALVSTCLV